MPSDPEQKEAREAIYAEITRQANELTHALGSANQATALRELAEAYAHVSNASVKPAAKTLPKTPGTSRDW